MRDRLLIYLARVALVMTLLGGMFALWWPLGEPTRIHAQHAPYLSVTPATAAPGDKITLQGSGWPAGVQLGARMYEASSPGGASAFVSGAIQVDSNGSFSAQGTVPNTLFGQGSRGALNVVPGSYTVAVSAGTTVAATVPFTVGAPAQGALLWGTVYFDTDNNGQIDPSDSTSGMVGVTIVGPTPGSPPRQAITDAKGRYVIYPVDPGSYTMSATAQLFNADWTGSASTTAQNGQAVRADIMLRPAPPNVAPERYFSQTGFAVDNDTLWDYFNKRGGIRTFGYPVSRTFQFLGFTTQFFQREIMQLGPDGNARTMNLLDPGLMPYTRINGSQFPAVHPSVKAETPPVGSPDYTDQVIAFVQQHAPNDFNGQHVGFFDAFMNTVTLQDAFPQGGGDPSLLPLLNLEIWGTPTSNPTPDPSNSNFIYLRFQRGILHFQGYDSNGNPITEGILLGDWFKSLITGRNLPPDLEQQAKADNSPFLRQYDPSKPDWVADPTRLPNTDLTFAFEPQ